jgi:exodeoxyribonuclease V alpha subunit
MLFDFDALDEEELGSRLLPGDGPWTGEITAIRFHNPDTGFTIAVFRMPSGHEATIKGITVQARVGMRVHVTGVEINDARWGPQIDASVITEVLPTTADQIRAYLASGVIAGIGAVTANRIVDAFGDDTLEILDHAPNRLEAVHGIGPATAEKIRLSWSESTALRDVMITLAGASISPAVAGRCVRHFGSDAATIITTDPYRLLEVSGIGWRQADTVADALGVEPDAPQRLAAGIAHAVDAADQHGHCYLPLGDLVGQAKALLVEPPAGKRGRVTLSNDALRDEFTRLVADEVLCVEGADLPMAQRRVYTQRMLKCETGVAEMIATLAKPLRSDRMASEFAKLAEAEWLTALRPDDEVTPAPEQVAAVKAAMLHGVSVLTGGPGCGKSWTVARMVDLAQRYGFSVTLAAPTGRAAKRLKDLSGADAKTVHRLLAGGGGDPDDDDDDSSLVPGDLIIVDETSMMDIRLMRRLTAAVAPGTHLVLVGDIDQLPSIGPGKVLMDIIDSGAVPVTRLVKVFRQAAQSGIVVAAHAINTGKRPDRIGAYRDLMFRYVRRGSAEVADMIVDLVRAGLPEHGIAPSAMPVLTPQRKGDCGVNALNERLQQALNPPAPHRRELKFADRVFRVGDRVMQVKNDYDRGVFNGTTGRIESIDGSDGDMEMTVITEDGDAVEYERSHLGDLVLAYAMTIHKAQGSEYPGVIIPILPEASFMLRRNLLYTALTRARRAAVVIAAEYSLGKAVNTVDSHRRHTYLAERLRVAAA